MTNIHAEENSKIARPAKVDLSDQVSNNAIHDEIFYELHESTVSKEGIAMGKNDEDLLSAGH